MKRLSPASAVAIGTLWVNIPVLPLMFSPLGVFLWVIGRKANQHPSPSILLAMLGLLLLGFIVAWSWWSFMVPRWRLWAWRRVENPSELENQAVRAGLIWPEGHFFEKTEFRSKAVQAELDALEEKRRFNAH